MKKYSFLLFLILFLFSCEKDEPSNPIPETDGPIYYISNEGAFGFGNGSVSMYYPKENKMVNDAFKEANGRRPGDVLQSISTVNGKVYMIVNASNKIEIAATKTLKEIGVIQHLSLPRYMEVTSNSRAYISIWGNGGKLMVMDLLKDEIIDSIEVGNGPEKMLSTDGKLFVCNSGGFGEDSILTVIDQAQNKVVTELAVGDNPTDIVKGMSGTIWVLCKGKVLYDANWQIIGHTPSYLVQTNVSAQSILRKLKISDNQHPERLGISPDGKYLYFGAGYGFSGIYRYDITNNSIDPTVFINRDFYGFNVEPSTGDIYGLEATSFTVSGKMLRYAADGSLKNDFTVGVGPNGICF